MILLLLLTLIAAVAATGTVRALRTDGYRAVPTDTTRLP